MYKLDGNNLRQLTYKCFLAPDIGVDQLIYSCLRLHNNDIRQVYINLYIGEERPSPIRSINNGSEQTVL